MALPNIIQNHNNDIQTIKSTYLPLSGGTMTGAIKGKSGVLLCSVDDLDIFICGGTNSTNNSYIQLNGGSHPTTPGQIFISPCISPSNKSVWTMKPDGSVVCSSTNSSIAVSKLVIGGMTITDAFIKGSGGSSTGAHLYSGANNFDGATLQLYSRAHGSYPGHFYLRTSSKSSSGDTAGTSYDLVGKPDGTLTWSGKPVVCVTKWTSGTSWYRKYSDGWIEQGGQIGRQVTVTTNFNIAFTAIPTVICGCVYNRASTFYAREVYPNTVSTTAFTITNSIPAGSTSDYIKWYACGY